MKVELLEICWHGDSARISSIDFFPNSSCLVSAGVEDEEKLYINVQAWPHLQYWHVSDRAESSKKDPDLAKSEPRPKPTLTDVEFVYSLPPVHQRPVNTLRFSPNGQYLASGGDDGVVVLWTQRQRDIEFGKSEKKLAWACNRVLRGHSADVYDIAWSSDSKYLVSCSLDGSAILFSAEKGKAVQRLEGHKKTVQGCAIDPLMKYIITLSPDRTARVYKTTKGKAQLQFYLHHILKYRDYNTKQTESPDKQALAPDKECPAIDNNKFDDDSSLSSLEHHRKQSHLMFADEAECPVFQRRTAWSPEGSFVLLPAAIFKPAPGEKPVFTVYGFVRKNLSQPAFHLPGFDKCPIVVRFCPYLFKKEQGVARSQGKEGEVHRVEMVDLPYAMVFAVASIDVVAIYSTQSIYPLAVVRNIHYHSITDLSFSKDKFLLISSSDGYCSIVRFENNVLGTRLPLSEIPPSVANLFQDYDKIDVNDISQFAKAASNPVTSTLRPSSFSGCDSKEREEQGGAADPGN